MAIRFEGADGLRGIACLIVLTLHALYFFYDGLGGFLYGLPKIGVWLFFVLSAFLLTCKFVSDGFSMASLLSYSIGRVLRILPLYFVFVIAYWWLGTAGIDSSEDLIKAMLLGGTYAHLWTVPVEFKYYLVLPLVAYVLIFSKKKFGATGSLAVGVMIVFAEQWLWPYWETPTANSAVKWYLSCFAMGAIAAMYVEQSARWATARNTDLVAFTFLFVVLLVSPYSRYIFFGVEPGRYLLNKFVYFGVLCAVLVVFVIHGRGMIGVLVGSYFLRQVGRWSYSIYLVHWMVVVKLASIFSGDLLAAVLSIVAALLIGGVIHYVLELPLERFRRLLMGRLLASKLHPLNVS
jgi:peptidoglycan/LPS O-acetylase OafA/YrhL